MGGVALGEGGGEERDRPRERQAAQRESARLTERGVWREEEREDTRVATRERGGVVRTVSARLTPRTKMAGKSRLLGGGSMERRRAGGREERERERESQWQDTTVGLIRSHDTTLNLNPRP